MRTYIAGQVSNCHRKDVERNFERGHQLLIAEKMNPVNPLKHVNCLASSRDAMKILLPLLLSCDAILMLDGWEFSEGARIEYELAKYVKMKVLFENDLHKT